MSGGNEPGTVDEYNIALNTQKTIYQNHLAVLKEWDFAQFNDISAATKYAESQVYYKQILRLCPMWFMPPNPTGEHQFERDGVRFSRFGPRIAPKNLNERQFFDLWDTSVELDTMKTPYSALDCFVSFYIVTIFVYLTFFMSV